MQRHYATILPKKGLTEDDDVESDTDAQQQKKRRIGVTVACDRCRGRKIRCDGLRPICTNCQDKANRCIYRDEGGLSPESSKLILEVFRLLNQLPPQESVRLIHSVKDEQSAWAIMLAVRSSRLVSSSAAGGTSQETTNAPSTQLEFQLQNPIAYPPVPVAGAALLSTRPYQHLTEGAPLPRLPTLSSSNQGQHPDSSDMNNGLLENALAQRQFQQMTNTRRLCDPRLNNLEIMHWTDVDIDNDLAARCISLYLETDHPLLGLFDPDLFVEQLISGQEQFCSALLVNALLYWACMYSAIDNRTDDLALPFCEKAERLWAMERDKGVDSTTNLAAAEFLSMGYLGHGRDHAVLEYLTEAAEMGARMGLFDSPGQTQSTDTRGNVADVQMSRRYAAWGVFNWITLMSLFYHQPGSICPSPPKLAVPLNASCEYMGDTFPRLCQFWTIMREVHLVYQGESGTQPWGKGASLSFAEFKFRELMAWSNSLPPHLLSELKNPHHVHVLQSVFSKEHTPNYPLTEHLSLWLHAAILDLFRPFIDDSSQKNVHLRTFSLGNNTPSTVVQASTERLKVLILSYRLNYASSMFTMLWHTALTYVANAVLQHTEDENWYYFFLLCLYGYQRLSRSWRVALAISKGLLSMTLRKTNIPASTVRRLLADLEANSRHDSQYEIRAPFTLELNSGQRNPNSVTVEQLAGQLEENIMFRSFTNFFDEELN